jgi:hypothetical protein
VTFFVGAFSGHPAKMLDYVEDVVRMYMYVDKDVEIQTQQMTITNVVFAEPVGQTLLDCWQLAVCCCRCGKN